MLWDHQSFPFNQGQCSFLCLLEMEPLGGGSVQGRTLGDFAVSNTSVSPNTTWVSSVPLPSSLPLVLSLFLMTLWTSVGGTCICVAQPPSGCTEVKASSVPEGWSQGPRLGPCVPLVNLGFWSDWAGEQAGLTSTLS